MAPSSSRSHDLRLGLRLEWITIVWNAAEVGITIGLGVTAGSLALVAFGLDSLVEIFTSVVVVWQLRGDQADSNRVRKALALVAVAFLALGAFLVVTSVLRLWSGARPDESIAGIFYLAATVVVMMTLARMKTRVGTRLANETLLAEAHMTFLDGLLATGILSSLLLNALLDWWWTDPLAAAVVGVMALGEARENHRLAKG